MLLISKSLIIIDLDPLLSDDIKTFKKQFSLTHSIFLSAILTLFNYRKKNYKSNALVKLLIASFTVLIAHCAPIINHDSLMDELHQDAMHNTLELIPEPDISASGMSLSTMTFI